jgi:hypothetical protein
MADAATVHAATAAARTIDFLMFFPFLFLFRALYQMQPPFATPPLRQRAPLEPDALQKINMALRCPFPIYFKGSMRRAHRSGTTGKRYLSIV